MPFPVSRPRLNVPLEAAESAISGIAREIALDIYEMDTIAQNFGFASSDDEGFRAIVESPEFQRTYRTLKAEISGVDSTPVRIRQKAQAAMESTLPDFAAAMVDPTIAPGQRVAIWNGMMKLAGLAEQPRVSQGDAGPGQVININITDASGNSKRVSVQQRPVLDGFAESTLAEAGDDAND